MHQLGQTMLNTVGTFMFNKYGIGSYNAVYNHTVSISLHTKDFKDSSRGNFNTLMLKGTKENRRRRKVFMNSEVYSANKEFEELEAMET
jgi:hypothetical protein